MKKCCPENERKKAEYVLWLEKAEGKQAVTVDAVLKAIERFEIATRHKPFKNFHLKQVLTFREKLAEETGASGQPLSASTITTTLKHLRAFFFWLSREPGYKQAVKANDIVYFTPSEQDRRIAGARRERPVATLDDIRKALGAMPSATHVEQRNRAVIAFAILSGARDGAIASFRLKHVDLDARTVFHDGRDVKTKARKTFKSVFFPVGPEPEEIFAAYVRMLKEDLGFRPEDPLFPSTAVALNDSGEFQRNGLTRDVWTTAEPIRRIFRDAFKAVGLPAFNPHSFARRLRSSPMNWTSRAKRKKPGRRTSATKAFARRGKAPERDAYADVVLIKRLTAAIEKLNPATEDEAVTEQEKIKRKWATVEALVGSQKRLAMVAADLVRHFEDRVAAMDGKAMVVCMSRRICVALYNQIIALRPDWHSDDDAAGSIKVVMTGSAADPQDWQPHIGSKGRRDLLAKRAKDPKDELKLVIVRDMWLTGFDAPSMHTMYVDKPMKGHGLMQAIARVNRVFRDKPAGLVVDYIGIAQNLKNALGQYSGSDQRQAGIDEAEAVAVLLEKYEVVKAMYHGFDYSQRLTGSPHERLFLLGEAMEWILAGQNEAAARETTEDRKRRENRRYQDAVLALSKAFALASASDEAREIRDEVGFFQAVRAALTKAADNSGVSSADREFAIQQILDRAVVSTEIVDILAAAGITAPDISILSDEFLAEVQQLEKKNLALEALRKLLNDEIRSRSKTNVVETKRFSERLEAAIARYPTNAISTVEVLQELINLAKEVRAARRRGEDEGLSQDEVAFYDALAESQGAVDAMGNDSLKVIAHELIVGLKGNVSVDWSHRESARARMRVLVKRILRKHGYPPDLQDVAVQTVLRQAEALSASWVR